VAKTISLPRKPSRGLWHQANSAKAPGAEQNADRLSPGQHADLEGPEHGIGSKTSVPDRGVFLNFFDRKHFL